MRAMSMCVCVCAHVCVSVHLAACARARVRACVYACLCERIYGFVRFHRIAIPRMCVASACVRRGAARALPSHGGGLRYLWLGPRRALRPRARLRSVRPAGCRARSAAGITWTCRTAFPGWAARESHTSVVDAVSGAIYVIGGVGGSTVYNDVWASTDGGARAGLGQGGDRGVLEWGTRVGYSRSKPPHGSIRTRAHTCVR